jgi:hypothetical protein
MIKAIPTTYANVRFRSRLEARWAAFFDLAGVPWEYEPIDLDGWCPDFRIISAGQSVLVEVKPVERKKCEICEKMKLPKDASFEKARAHCRERLVMCLGDCPNEDADFFGLGTLFDPPKDSEIDWFAVSTGCAPKNTSELWRKAGNAVQWAAK